VVAVEKNAPPDATAAAAGRIARSACTALIVIKQRLIGADGGRLRGDGAGASENGTQVVTDTRSGGYNRVWTGRIPQRKWRNW
jgi:hypothetical protein